MTAKSYELTPMNVGATVRGIDPADIGDAELGRALYAEWLKYGFLVFRDLPLDNDQHIAFSNHFGVAEIHPLPAIRAAENPLFMTNNCCSGDVVSSRRGAVIIGSGKS